MSTRTDEWLLRHHMTRVVEWAVQTLGRGIVTGLGVSVVFAVVSIAVGGDGSQVVAWASVGSVLGFGCTLWFSSAPFPLDLDDDG